MFRRVAAIRFLIKSTMAFENVNLEKLAEMEKKLSEMCDDLDPRVRIAAAEGLAGMCDGKRCLSMDSYRIVKRLSRNSNVNVRLEALKIMLKFAEHYPNMCVFYIFCFTRICVVFKPILVPKMCF